MNEAANGKNSKVSALKDLSWPTVALILATGGGNFLATQKNSTDRDLQIQQAVSHIRELHSMIDDFEKRQKQSLDNQTELLKHDSILLKEVHDIALNLDRWKAAEQMRGAP